jgi:hypothetical protein
MMIYDNPWLFNNQPFNSEDILHHAGFVYCIYGPEQSYIGRKYFWTIRKKHKAKKGEKRIRKESDWKDYYSSSKVLQEDVERLGKDNFKREIVSIHKTRGDVNYAETKLQFVLNVLESEEYYNDNILIKYKKRPVHIMEARLINEQWRKYF